MNQQDIETMFGIKTHMRNPSKGSMKNYIMFFPALILESFDWDKVQTLRTQHEGFFSQDCLAFKKNKS